MLEWSTCIKRCKHDRAPHILGLRRFHASRSRQYHDNSTPAHERARHFAIFSRNEMCFQTSPFATLTLLASCTNSCGAQVLVANTQRTMRGVPLISDVGSSKSVAGGIFRHPRSSCCATKKSPAVSVSCLIVLININATPLTKWRAILSGPPSQVVSTSGGFCGVRRN